MAAAIKDTARLGVVVAVQSDAYRKGIAPEIFQVRRGGKPVDSLRPWTGSEYSLCLFRCIQGINEWMTEQGIDQPIHYTMEAGKLSENIEATGVFARASKSEVISARYRLRGYGFVPKNPETPWLFAADYLAWWWQRNHFVSARDNAGSQHWQKPIVPLIESVSHRSEYMDPAGIGMQGLVNAFYGLMGAGDDAR